MNNRLQRWQSIYFQVPYLLLLVLFCIPARTSAQVQNTSTAVAKVALEWGRTITLPFDKSDQLPFLSGSLTKPGLNAAFEKADTGYGSQYCRLLAIGDSNWLAVYTVRTNEGYQKNPEGGLRLEIAKSTNNGNSWMVIARLKDPGRDLDNGQLIQLKNGNILLSARSVRWHDSYRLPVYQSNDKGVSWKYISSIDHNEGPEGSLGNPDKGIYEPHFTFLKDGRLAVFYANEKHVTDPHPYSQIIAEKVSSDNGQTWGNEIFAASDALNKNARPGMPVCALMKNDSFMLVYEVCGTKGCNIYQKTSPDGLNWISGIGTAIDGQSGAPFLLSMTGGRLIVTSNRGNISISRNFGQSWTLQDRPWVFTQAYEKDWQQALWPSLYQFGNDRIGVTAARKRPKGQKGYDVTIRFGKVK